jgi:hypothetical protein
MTAASSEVLMSRIVFLGHLDTGTAIFSDLVDIGTHYRAQTNVRMPQAVRRARLGRLAKSTLLPWFISVVSCNRSAHSNARTPLVGYV